MTWRDICRNHAVAGIMRREVVDYGYRTLQDLMSVPETSRRKRGSDCPVLSEQVENGNGEVRREPAPVDAEYARNVQSQKREQHMAC